MSDTAERSAKSPFMKTVLWVATAAFLAWAGWLTNGVLAAGKETVRNEGVAKQLERMNDTLDKMNDRLQRIEMKLAMHDVR